MPYQNEPLKCTPGCSCWLPQRGGGGGKSTDWKSDDGCPEYC